MVNSNIKVSVITPVYNGEKYIGEAIESILGQTFRDFEYIIINDGSDDRTAEIIASYNDPRILRIDNRTNIRIPASLNKALQLAKGKYVVRNDADDISLPEKLQKQVDFLESDADVCAVGTSNCTIDENGRQLGVSMCLDGQKSIHFLCMPTIMVRKSCFEKLGMFREDFEIAEDYDFYLRFIEHFRIENIAEPLYKYRIHNSSVTSEKKIITQLYTALAIEMAEERKRFGKDRLMTASLSEARIIIDQKLGVSGLKLRKILSHNYYTWADASKNLDEYARIRDYARTALRLYPLNFRAILMFMGTLFR